MAKRTGPLAALAGVALAAAPHAGEAADEALAIMANADGEAVGEVTLRQTPHGVLLYAAFENLPPGAHAFHIHETGLCEPSFASAGGHFNPEGVEHGIDNPEGMHAGDMPNIHVPESGVLVVEVLNARLNLDSTLFDADGAALVIHEGPDDYVSDPAGAAGPRIACGVIVR